MCPRQSRMAKVRSKRGSGKQRHLVRLGASSLLPVYSYLLRQVHFVPSGCLSLVL